MLTLLALLPAASAQSLPLPDLSPRAEVMQTVGVTELRVSYSSPAKRDRTIWGELVPYGELWRTGANRATTLETDGPLMLGETTVPAGRYAVFTVPGEREWTVILNSNADQGGTGSYDQKLDVARLTVTPEPGAERERMTFVFSDTTASGTRLDLVWDGVRVGIPIQVDTAGILADQVEQYQLQAAGRLARAARHYARNEQYDEALRLVETAIGIRETWFAVWIQADTLKQAGMRRQAWRAAKRALELGEGSENFFYEDRVREAVKEWRRG